MKCIVCCIFCAFMVRLNKKKREGEPNVTNFRLTIEYDGRRYSGWQRQGNTDNTIQGKIEQILSRMTGHAVEINGAGRTDAGVHARAQVANVKIRTDKTAQEIAALVKTHRPERIVMGFPRNMDGSEGPRADLYREFAALLEELLDQPVVLWDERRTTIEAHQILSDGGYHGKKRKNTVDAVAASLILEGYLNYLNSHKE